MTCNDSHCDECDRLAGLCLKCHAGFYLDDNHNCQQCPAMCTECDSAEVCTKCEHVKAYLVDGVCECNNDNSWFEIDGFKCFCSRDYIEPDNSCSTCADIIPDCHACEAQDHFNETYIDLGPPPALRPEQPQYWKCV